jgi:DNA replication protein DnaC
MSELMMERIRENLTALKMKNTLTILDNYLERAVKDDLNIVEVLDHIFTEEAKNKRVNPKNCVNFKRWSRTDQNINRRQRHCPMPPC